MLMKIIIVYVTMINKIECRAKCETQKWTQHKSEIVVWYIHRWRSFYTRTKDGFSESLARSARLERKKEMIERERERVQWKKLRCITLIIMIIIFWLALQLLWNCVCVHVVVVVVIVCLFIYLLIFCLFVLYVVIAHCCCSWCVYVAAAAVLPHLSCLIKDFSMKT